MRFYTPDGNMIDCKPKEAYSAGLKPSVNNIMNIIDKPWLSKWLVNMAIESALTIPEVENEPLDRTAERIKLEVECNRNKSSDLGTRIHYIVKKFLMCEPRNMDLNEDETRIIIPIEKWIIDGIYQRDKFTSASVENPIVGKDFAGTPDLIYINQQAVKTVFDWKSKFVKHPGFYKKDPSKIKAPSISLTKEHKIQLGGYRAIMRGLGLDIPDRYVIVFISTNPDFPGVWEKEITDIEWGEKAFLSIWETWKILNKWGI